MFDKSKFNENINTLSETAKTVLEQKYTDKEMKLFYAPIEWAEEFHALTTVDGRMNKITLPTVPAMRVITNDCLSDVLYYFTDYHRQHLLDIICMKMNRIFKEFKEVYPDFCGPVGIISHSLGGVISYDLLSIKNQEVGSNDQIYSVAFPRTNYPKLDFEPKFLFTLGSPIGAVMVLRGLKYEDFRLSEDIEFMNIYNPYDPLAYRLEPLISQDYEGLEAKSIDTYETNEQSYYFPRISALLPEAPSFIKSAKNLLPNFN
ncbi:DDHD-domain-containing protein, partial [Neoconidiobolus thromboides FSU 785]